MSLTIRRIRRWVARLFGAGVLLALFCISRRNLLLFHAIGEFFSVVIAWGMFVFAWNSRRFIDNGYLVFLGIAYLFVGILDFTHVLAYEGMGVLHGGVPGLSVRAWTAARYLEGLSMLVAPLFLRRRVSVLFLFTVYAVLVAGFLLLVAGDRGLPACPFRNGEGISIGVVNDLVIAAIMIGAAALLYRHRSAFARHVLLLLLASIGLSVTAQVAFAAATCVGPWINTIGHLVKLVSFYLIFKAIIQTGLEKPYELLFRELKQSERALKASNTAKDRFFSIMAHDLKDLFNVLFGYSEVLLNCYDEFSDEKKKTYIHAIRRSSEQVYRMLENLLYWSRMQVGGLTAQPEEVALAAVVGETFSLLKAVSEQKQVQVVADVDPEIKAWVDANMVQVVLRNLVSNAIKFAGPGGHVAVSARAEGGRTVISVRDDGEGMSREEVERVLRAEVPGRVGGDEDGGTGLGLVLCKEFVDLNDGDLRIESRPGAGTEVVVSFPSRPSG